MVKEDKLIWKFNYFLKILVSDCLKVCLILNGILFIIRFGSSFLRYECIDNKFCVFIEFVR